MKRPSKGISWQRNGIFHEHDVDEVTRSKHLSAEQITDMCATSSCVSLPGSEIGLLVYEHSSPYRHHVYQSATFDGNVGLQRVTLENLLRREPLSTQSFILSRRHRLNIAVTLASGVLQLDTTSWLDQCWSSDDIFFFCSPRSLSLEPTTSPFLSWKLFPSRSHNKPQTSSDRKWDETRSEILLALGLTLVELCLGKTLEDLQGLAGVKRTKYQDRSEVAKKLLNKVYDEGGCRYGDVVRRCLSCPYDFRDLSFENVKFQEAVYDTIVTPLAQDLDDFEGQYLSINSFR